MRRPAGVCALQPIWPLGIPWAYGLKSGAVALVANLAVYLGLALILRRSAAEQARLDALFDETARSEAGSSLPAPQPV